MNLTELRLALGVTEALMHEALWVLSLPGDRRIRWAATDRLGLGDDWRGRRKRRDEQLDDPSLA